MAKLKLAENKSDFEKAMDAIETSWANWQGPTGQPWVRYDGPTTPWSATVSASLDKGRYVVVGAPHVPLWQRILGRLKGVLLWTERIAKNALYHVRRCVARCALPEMQEKDCQALHVPKKRKRQKVEVEKKTEAQSSLSAQSESTEPTAQQAIGGCLPESSDERLVSTPAIRAPIEDRVSQAGQPNGVGVEPVERARRPVWEPEPVEPEPPPFDKDLPRHYFQRKGQHGR